MAAKKYDDAIGEAWLRMHDHGEDTTNEKLLAGYAKNIRKEQKRSERRAPVGSEDDIALHILDERAALDSAVSTAVDAARSGATIARLNHAIENAKDPRKPRRVQSVVDHAIGILSKARGKTWTERDTKIARDDVGVDEGLMPRLDGKRRLALRYAVVATFLDGKMIGLRRPAKPSELAAICVLCGVTATGKTPGAIIDAIAKTLRVTQKMGG